MHTSNIDPKQIGYSWVPPGIVTSSKIQKYFDLLPKENVPKIGSAGERHRIRQLNYQLPKQDIDYAYSKHIGQDKECFDEFVTTRNEVALDVGYIRECGTNSACANCKEQINQNELAVNATKFSNRVIWHPRCFQCCVCNELLADLTYCAFEEKIFCERHYAEIFKPRCNACDEQLNIGCGLINRRRNCFLNATIQALFYIPKISNCLQTEINRNKCVVKDCVTCGVLDLFAITKSSKEACSPYQLYDRLKKTNQRFLDLLSGHHQDAHEFLLIFNEELERPPHSARWFSNDFSVKLATTINCDSCGKVHESTSRVTDLALHLEGNRTIQSAVNSYFDYDDIDFLCEECRTYDTVKKKHHILSAPPYVCLQLRRFSEDGTKITDFIEISGLSLKKHFLKTQTSEWSYELVAVVNHFGESRNVGHYNTVVLTPNGEHYEFDDRSVRKVSSNLVSGENAYILFYKRIEEPWNYGVKTFSTSSVNINDEQCPTTEGRSSAEIDDESECNSNRLNNHIQVNISLVDTHQLSEDESLNSTNQNIPGRRIVDVDYLFKQMAQFTKFTCQICESGRMVYSNEFRRGLLSSFTFICENCGNSQKVDSCPSYDVTGDVNTSAVLGIISVGLGFYHLQEFMAHLNVPVMSYVTFHKYEKDRIQVEYFKFSKQLEAEALAEEVRLAKAMNEVDSAGNALIAVEFDGSWEKRSYTTNFTSLAGCAAIVGLRTQKILYSGIKKKYCHICTIAKSMNRDPRKHVCKRNYKGPSSGMETEIIVEGFKFCAEKGARFNKFVGDGDSSTYKALRDLQLYKNPSIMIEKFECVNHLFRNFLKQYKARIKSAKISIRGRNLLTVEIGRNLCKGIRLAAQHWRNSDVEMEEKYRNLEDDIMNAFQHYLGAHDNCADYFCEKTTDPLAAATISILKETGMYYEVMDLCQYYFGNNVKSLVAGLSTNKVEGFNSRIAKTIGGKRICNSTDDSYELRTDMAEAQYNTGGHSGSKFQEFIFDESTPMMRRMENDRKRKCAKNAIAKENKPKNFHNDEPPAKKKKKQYYADGHEDLDMTDVQYEVARARFMQRLQDNQLNRLNIEVETRGQPHSFRWIEVRKLLLTSSYFGRILNVRGRRSYTNIVEEILYKNIQYANSADMRHQRIYEKEGLRIFTEMYPFDTINSCGIFIDAKLSFLGATPFRVYGNDAIVVVKCPKKEFGKSMEDAIKRISFWTGDHTNRSINKKSLWFFEIQGKLHITQKKMAYLVIYLGNQVYEIVEIERDDTFWVNEMEKELCYFYNEALLKELIDSREGRTMELRQYDSEKHIFE